MLDEKTLISEALKRAYSFYGVPFKSSDTTNLKASNRMYHGIMHAIGCMELMIPVHNLYKSHVADYDNAMCLFAEQFGITVDELILLLQITAIFHDTGRQADGPDKKEWEEKGAQNLYDFLKDQKINKKLLQLLQWTISYKDDDKIFIEEAKKIGFSEKIDFFRQLLNMVDAIEITRNREVFECHYLPIMTKVSKIENLKKDLIPLIKDLIPLIKKQYKKICDESRGDGNLLSIVYTQSGEEFFNEPVEKPKSFARFNPKKHDEMFNEKWIELTQNNETFDSEKHDQMVAENDRLQNKYKISFSFWGIAKEKVLHSLLWIPAMVIFSLIVIPIFLWNTQKTKKKLENAVSKNMNEKKDISIDIENLDIENPVKFSLGYPAHIGFSIYENNIKKLESLDGKTRHAVLKKNS